MESATIWFTGLSGSGKSTIAKLVKQKLAEEGIPLIIFDGDEVRKSLSRDLDYSKESRDKHITRIADVCKIISSQGVLNLACVIAPTREIREYARRNIPSFVEVYVKCPLSECQKRDPKGHYQKVKEGAIKDFVGVTIPYEEPLNPEIVIDTYENSSEQCAQEIVSYLKKNGCL